MCVPLPASKFWLWSSYFHFQERLSATADTKNEQNPDNSCMIWLKWTPLDPRVDVDGHFPHQVALAALAPRSPSFPALSFVSLLFNNLN